MGALDIGVAGCGPAGLTAALLLDRQGHRVTLYERFAVPRAVGSGLMIQPTGLAVLAELGLAEGLKELGAPIHRLFGKVEPSGVTVLEVRYDWLRQQGLCGYGVHRAALFDLLHGAVLREGIAIETGRTVAATSLEAGGVRRLVFEGRERSRPHDLVVDALGAKSPLVAEGGKALKYGALWASLDACDGFDGAALEQRYRRASVMAGVLPIGRAPGREKAQAAFFWLLRSDRVAEWRAGGLEAWKDAVRGIWPATAPLLDQIGDAEQLTLARYTHRTLRKPAEAALIHIGDAWHATSPQLGQGANMGLLDAWALAKAMGEERDMAAALAKAVRMRRGHVRLYQALSALFTPAYQSDSRVLPFVRDRIVPPFGRLWPATVIQAQMVAGTFGNPLKPLGLVPA
jgi:2-polyprenyl-6-methoxyphenol hydroxylase-like FAD-dependent oxidoreductase